MGEPASAVLDFIVDWELYLGINLGVSASRVGATHLTIIELADDAIFNSGELNVRRGSVSNHDEQRQRSALEWIVEKAGEHELPYQVVGGLAAIAHGGSRPLHDIDLYMPIGDPHWPDFLAAIDTYVVWGPEAVVEGPWDLTYLKINYYGQKIEIGGSESLRIRSCTTGEWVEQVIDYRSSVSRRVLGCTVAVMPLAQLIAYKNILGREVDQQDVHELMSQRL
jgi:hypothetical protein